MVTIFILLHLAIPINGLLYLAARRERERNQLLVKEALVRISNSAGIRKW